MLRQVRSPRSSLRLSGLIKASLLKERLSSQDLLLYQPHERDFGVVLMVIMIQNYFGESLKQ